MRISSLRCHSKNASVIRWLKQYDLIKPARCLIEEKQRYLHMKSEDSESYVAYFTISDVVGELDFPSSEIFYYPGAAV